LYTMLDITKQQKGMFFFFQLKKIPLFRFPLCNYNGLNIQLGSNY
jgi:hypothetical protein